MIDRVLSGRYKVISVVGEGGMSQVWRAQDLNTGKLVAVKVLREEFREDETFVRRFEREAMAASRMTHPNIANLLDVGTEEDGTRYIVIEYVSGKTLKQFIQESGALKPETAAQIIIRVLAAVQHAHLNGVIHRDIKPQNILIDKEGTVKVTDFGIARVANTQTMSQDTDVVMGSVYYFSPEQAKGKVVDEKSDIYSVGVVFYEMLTGEVPFTGDSPVAIAMKHVEEEPQAPSQLNPAVSEAVDYVVLRALEKRPRNRYLSAADMQRDVRLALERPDAILEALAASEQRERENKAIKERAEHRDRWVRRAVAGVFVAAFLGLIGYLGYSVTWRVMESRRNTVEVPNFISMYLDQAAELVDEIGLKLAVREDKYALVPNGAVVDQSIAPGTFVKPGDVITIVVGQSQYDLTMPNVVGMPVEKASQTLSEQGITVSENNYVISKALSDTVVAQEPAAGSPIQKEDTVILHISGGSVTMPVLKGLTQAQAEQTVLAFNLVLKDVFTRVVDDPALVNVVVEQVPDIYESVRPKTTVQITIGVASSSLYETEIVIDLSALQKGATLTVTLNDENGEEKRQYVSGIPEDLDSITIPLYSKSARRARAHVYVDNVLQDSITVVFEPR